MHAERLVVGDEHGPGRLPPFGRLIGTDTELPGAVRVALDGVGCCPQVLLRHEVSVDIIIGDGAVLVGTGNAVDAEVAVGVVVAERVPEPGGLDEHLEANFALEGIVAGGREVADDGGGDVGVNVEGSCAGWPIPRDRLTADGAPGEGGPL